MNIEAIENPFAKVSTSLNRANTGTTEQMVALKEGEGAEDATPKTNTDTVTISLQAKHLSQATVSSKVLTRAGEEEKTPEEKEKEDIEKRVKEIQEEMTEIQQEIEKIMASDLGQAEKMEQVRAQQIKLAGLQTEMEALLDPDKYKK